MRILAIRGSNLASLAGPFELDLGRPPLDDARLFLITGPVGAGKSTLLDALSVALFHRAPKLVEAGKAKLDDLPADDARHLLRRGTAGGFAEVDFQADDGGSYRVRWEVQRARGRVDGAIHKPSCRISCLETGQLLARGRATTEAEVRRLLGLDFSQFQRAVLLAQGEFASFLKAGSNERSALLEQMTGTELYGRVSQAAHARAKIESEKVKSIERQLDALQSVPPEDLLALKNQLEQNGRQLHEMVEFVRVLERERDWFTHDSELRIGVEQAKAEHAEVLAEEPAFKEKKEELRLTENALSLASLFSVVDELRREAEVLGTGLERQEGAAVQAREKRDEAQRAADLAWDALAEAEVTRREAERVIEDAVRLDEQLKLAKEAVSDADSLCRQANERKATADASLDSVRILLADLQKTARELEEFQAVNCDHLGLLGEHKYWLEQILQYEKVKGDESRQRKALADLSLSIQDLRKKEQGVSDELSTEGGEIERLEATAAALEAEIAALGPEELARVEGEVRSRYELAAALEKRNIELQALGTEVQRILSERAEAVRDLAAARGVASETDSRLPALEAAAAEAERAWLAAVLSGKPNVEALRSELRHGAPCPVCGALDHPWASTEATLMEELVEKSGKRREALAQELAVLRGRKAQQEAHLAQLQASIRQADKRLNSLTPERDRLHAGIDEGVRRLGIADSQAVAEATASAKSRLESVAKELRVVHDKEAVLRSALQQWRSRSRVFEKHTALNAKVHTELTVARSRQESLTGQLTAMAEVREKLGNRISAALTCMPEFVSGAFQTQDAASDQLGRDLPLLDDDPVALRRILADRAGEWMGKLAQLEETSRRVAAVEAEIKYREQEGVQAAEAAAEAHTHFLAKQQETAELADKRSQLLEGRSVEEVRLALLAKVEAAREARRSAERDFDAANAELIRLTTTIGSKTDHVQTNSERLAARQAALNRKLGKRGLVEEDARRLAARGEGWCQETRDAISDYENRGARIKERLEERERHLALHGRMRPSRSSEEVERLLQETAGQRTAVECAGSEIRARLLQAQSVEDRRKAITEQLVAATEEGRVWIELGQIIGSADGKLFRNLSQTYTLDLLLDHANVHLSELKPRYRLERCPDDVRDPLGIMIIDRDSGDERRPITTLSGGETFLVSLALALGLSSLHSRRVHLGSLFIDEGFGALDSAALQTALAALQKLEHQDRQIGIISHLDGLAEHFPAEVRVVPIGFGASRVELATVT